MARFVWAERSQVGIDADKAGRALEKLEATGEVTAQRIVHAARPKLSPLHPAFEWDDKVAAERYRLEQARYIARSIRIISEDTGEPERVFFHVKTEKVDAYVTKAVILADEDLRQAALHDALTMLTAARDRYRELEELGAVWEAIDQLQLEKV